MQRASRSRRESGERRVFFGGLCAGFTIGAGVMYLLDPNGGGRRRALVRDKAARTMHETAGGIARTRRDLENRSHGWLARLRWRFQRKAVPDDIVEERVRAALGHVCAHPSAVRVRSRAGSVELTGPILQTEHPHVIARVEAVPGVRDVEDRLERFTRADWVRGSSEANRAE